MPKHVPCWMLLKQPHRFLWLDSYELSVAMGVYFTYCLYLSITCIWLYSRRKHYLFCKNPMGITLCSALMQWLMGTSHVWRYYFSATLPAGLVIWRNYVFFPLCLIFSLQARGMHILFEVIWTRSIGNPILSRQSSFGRESSASLLLLPSPHSASASLSPIPTPSHMNFIQRTKVVLKNPRLHVWLKNRGTYIMAGSLSGIHFLTAIVLQYVNGGQKFPERPGCTFCVETFGIIMSVALYVVIWCPLMLFYLSEVKDAYGLRRDLKIGMSYALPCYILYVCFRTYDFLQALRPELPSFIFLLLAMISLHTSTVTAPLIRTIFWEPGELDGSEGEVEGSASASASGGGGGGGGREMQRKERVSSPHDIIISRPSCSMTIIIPHRPIPLEQVLNNPELSAPFELYSKNAFVWDSVLFHRAVEAFRKRASVHPNILLTEAQRLFEQYIDAGAPCEMNLSYQIVSRIHESLTTGVPSSSMFDEAQLEILRLVGNCTYRNFLYTLDPGTKARYMVPLGHLMPLSETIIDVNC